MVVACFVADALAIVHDPCADGFALRIEVYRAIKGAIALLDFFVTATAIQPWVDRHGGGKAIVDAGAFYPFTQGVVEYGFAAVASADAGGVVCRCPGVEVAVSGEHIAVGIVGVCAVEHAIGGTNTLRPSAGCWYGVVLAKLEDGTYPETELSAMMDVALTRADDRRLFGVCSHSRAINLPCFNHF